MKDHNTNVRKPIDVTTWITKSNEKKPIENLSEEELEDAIYTISDNIDFNRAKLERAEKKKTALLREHASRHRIESTIPTEVLHEAYRNLPDINTYTGATIEEEDDI